MDEEIIRMVHDHEKRLNALEHKENSAGQEGGLRKQSINEYILEVNPSGNTEKTVTCGYYLETQRSTGYFTPEDIETIYREAREPVSKNTSKDIQRAMKKGWIMEHDEKKGGKRTYRITTKGIEAIKKKFQLKE